MVELVAPFGVPDTTPVEELIPKPDGNEGETVYVAGPPVFVTVRFVIAVPTDAEIVDADSAIEATFTYLTTTIPDEPETPFVAVPPAEYPPLPPKPVLADRETVSQLVAFQLLPPFP